MDQRNTTFPRIVRFVLLLLFVSPAGFAQVTLLQEFEISDQFDVLHTDAEFREVVTVFLGADRKGTAYTEEWWTALGPALGDLVADGELQIVQFAHLRGVPFFVRGKVKKAFPDDPSAWVLLDWKGHFSRTYGFQKDSLNVLVFDAKGDLVLRRAVHDLDQSILEDMVLSIRAACGQKNGDPS